MNLLRRGFDQCYDLIKPVIFKITDADPEIAHSLFAYSLRTLQTLRLNELVLDNSANYVDPGYLIANAAGFNKNAEIDPRLMRLLGFDRVVIGTITADPWEGNTKPRVKRFAETGSLVNWMGLPSIGAEKIAQRLYRYGTHKVPLTVNLTSTPQKKGNELLKDLETTILYTRDIPFVDRYELNISCPNTHSSTGTIDARKENLAQLDEMVSLVAERVYPQQEIYLKVSPDSGEADAEDIVEIGEKYGVVGYVTTNTTTEHDARHITERMNRGGASGNAVWDASVRTQRYFAERISKKAKLVACGGINSVERARERCKIGNCKEIQIFTPLIFEGSGLLRKLREKP